MSETKRDYETGHGKPPAGRRFQKGQSGNPRGPRGKSLPTLLAAALNEPVYLTIDGHRRVRNRPNNSLMYATLRLPCTGFPSCSETGVI